MQDVFLSLCDFASSLPLGKRAILSVAWGDRSAPCPLLLHFHTLCVFHPFLLFIFCLRRGRGGIKTVKLPLYSSFINQTSAVCQGQEWRTQGCGFTLSLWNTHTTKEQEHATDRWQMPRGVSYFLHCKTGHHTKHQRARFVSEYVSKRETEKKKSCTTRPPPFCHS